MSWVSQLMRTFGWKAGPDASDAARRDPALVPAIKWTPTHRHKKGGLYRVLAHGVLETDRSEAVIYDDLEGTIWIRPRSEFYDGWFALIAERSSDDT